MTSRCEVFSNDIALFFKEKRCGRLCGIYLESKLSINAFFGLIGYFEPKKLVLHKNSLVSFDFRAQKSCGIALLDTQFFSSVVARVGK